MNRTQVEQWVGNPVFLTWWPYKQGCYTAKGVHIDNYGVGKQWELLKVTKGGLAVICDGVHTISVPPANIDTVLTLT